MYTKSLGKCATVAATKTVVTAWDRSQIIEVWRPNNVMWLLVRACAGVTGGQRKTSLQVNGHQTMGYQLKESVWVHHTCDGVCRGERWTETDNIAGEWRTSRDGLLKKHVWVHHTCEGCAGVTGGKRKTTLQLQVSRHQEMVYQLKKPIWVCHNKEGQRVLRYIQASVLTRHLMIIIIIT